MAVRGVELSESSFRLQKTRQNTDDEILQIVGGRGHDS